MTLVVVGHCPGPALLHRQARLGAIEGLDLALLVERQDHGKGRRCDVETDDIAQLFDEPRVVGELEALHLVWLKAVGSPDALDGTGAGTDNFRHHARGPVGRLGWRVGLGQSHDTLISIAVRQTQVFDLPVRRMISWLPTPSTLSRTISARHTCLCGVWRSCTKASSRRRPAGLSAKKFHFACARLACGLAKGIPSGIQMSDAVH